MTDPYKHGILGGPERPKPRCPVTNREFEDGSGALSHEEQTAMFVREAGLVEDLPTDGERDPQTGRLYEVGSGALPRSLQTERFLAELPPEQRVQRQANADALFAAEPAGRA
jgi:hypothetical protein